MATQAKSTPFHTHFKKLASKIRRRLALDTILTGAAVGMVIGAAACAAAWKLRLGDVRPFTAAASLIGAGTGLLIARRKRLKDNEIALYLDAKLQSDETISTAVELENLSPAHNNEKSSDDSRDSARAVIIAQATTTLQNVENEPEGTRLKKIRPRILRLAHSALPLAAAAIGVLSWLPLPPAPPAPPPPPGTEKIHAADIKGLEKAIKLGELNAKDEAQKQRFKELAEEAKRIREKLKDGVEKREAQADIAKLKDAIAAERMRLGQGEQRKGLEAALGKLSENGQLKDAEKALGDRDLIQFDEAMEQLANKLEQGDREKAIKTLEEAAEAAKKEGAPDVAKALEDQKKRLQQNGQQGQALKEMAKGLGENLSQEGKEALNEMNNTGSSKAAQKLAKEVEKAMKGLSEQERKQLAENLKKQAEKNSKGGKGQDPDMEPTERELKKLAEQLATPEGQQQLQEALRQMAQEPPPSEDAERQQALEDAEKGMGEAEKELGGGTPMPLPMSGNGQGQQGQPNQQGNGQGQKGQTAGNGKEGNSTGNGGKDSGKGENAQNATPGHSEGGGPGKHDGMTGVVDGPGIKSKANAKINKGQLMPGTVMGRTTGRAGETANTQGQGALGVVGPDEVGGIERSDVPEEYREQVGRYFQPK